MTYTPKEWQYKDTITAEELNRMEEGISSAQSGEGTELFPIVANINTRNKTCALLNVEEQPITAQQIADAYDQYKTIIVAPIINGNRGKYFRLPTHFGTEYNTEEEFDNVFISIADIDVSQNGSELWLVNTSYGITALANGDTQLEVNAVGVQAQSLT